MTDSHDYDPRDRRNPEELALRRAIVADPDDDTVRLAYADWLDERGRGVPAEYIRKAVAAERRREFAELRDLREFEVTHWRTLDTWHGLVFFRGVGVAYDRGFVSGLTGVSPGWWVGGRGDWLREWYPIRRVRFAAVPEYEPVFYFDHELGIPVQTLVLKGDHRPVRETDVHQAIHDERRRFGHGLTSLSYRDREFTRAVCRARWPGVEFYLPGDPDDATLANIEKHVSRETL